MISKQRQRISYDFTWFSMIFYDFFLVFLRFQSNFLWLKKLNIINAFTFDLLNTKVDSSKTKSTTQMNYHKKIKFSRQAMSK